MKGVAAQGCFTIMSNWIAKYRVNTGWMLLGQELCLFMQAVYFLIISRDLGVQLYGTFVGTAAFAQTPGPSSASMEATFWSRASPRTTDFFPFYWDNL
jgi:hypothetical protein